MKSCTIRIDNLTISTDPVNAIRVFALCRAIIDRGSVEAFPMRESDSRSLVVLITPHSHVSLDLHTGGEFDEALLERTVGRMSSVDELEAAYFPDHVSNDAADQPNV